VATLKRPAAAGLLILPGLLTLYLSFNGGGYFAGAPSLVAVVLTALLILRVTLAERPFSGLSGVTVLVVAALALFATWTLASVSWSDAPGRALIEFERALAYVLALLLFGSIPQSSSRLAWMVRSVAAAIVVVCTVALMTRVLPEVWPIAPNLSNDRLSYPLGYWNSLGILAATGVVLCLHLTADERERPVVRVVAAAALPIVCCTLLFTFSRGALAAGAVGAIAYLLLGRPRAVVGALLATVPTVAVAVKAAYHADLLQAKDYTTAAAVAQGRELALVVGLTVLGAVAVRILALPLDRRLAAVRRPEWATPALSRGAIVTALALVLVVLAAAGAPGYASGQYDKFVARQSLDDSGNLRGRLTDPANNGRLAHWRVALDSYRAQPLHGSGAGTYQLLWARHRPYTFAVVDGHSFYVEVMGELGLVGLILVVAALLVLGAGVLRRVVRHPRQRPLYAAVAAFLIAWALHAGVDWDWEMPAVTLPVLCVGAMAVGARRGRRPLAVTLPRLARVAIGLGLLALAVTPALTVKSQRELDDSVAAFGRGDCARSIDSALSSISALSMRPEPWELLGYCDMRFGQGNLAVRAMDQAVSRDPHSWEVHYGLALVRAADGRDPRAAMRATLRLNPRERIVRQAAEDFTTRTRRTWRKRALTAPLPLPTGERR